MCNGILNGIVCGQPKLPETLLKHKQVKNRLDKKWKEILNDLKIMGNRKK